MGTFGTGATEGLDAGGGGEEALGAGELLGGGAPAAAGAGLPAPKTRAGNNTVNMINASGKHNHSRFFIFLNGFKTTITHMNYSLTRQGPHSPRSTGHGDQKEGRENMIATHMGEKQASYS